MSDYQEAYRAAMAADEAYQAALVAVYGKDAGDARYWLHHKHAPIIAAKRAKLAADESLHAAARALRGERE